MIHHYVAVHRLTDFQIGFIYRMDCHGIHLHVAETAAAGLLYGMEDIVDHIVNGTCGGFILGTEEFVFLGSVIKIVLDEFLKMVSSFHMFLCLSVNTQRLLRESDGKQFQQFL